MYTKRYMYDARRHCCLELIRNGFVNAFEETLRLVELNKEEKTKALRGEVRQMPRDLKSDFEVMQLVMEALRESEKADRTGSFSESHAARMGLANRLGAETEGYQWLSEYLYKSCLQTIQQERDNGGTQKIEVLERFGLLDEQRDNIFEALQYIQKAMKANKSSQEESGSENKREELYQHLIRLYCKIGSKFHDKEDDKIKIKDSKSVLYYRKALKLARISGSKEKEAVCNGLLGRTMMKFKEFKKALKNFEAYHALSEECNDTYNVCNANFALSEAYKHLEDVEKSEKALDQCQKQAKENGYMIPMIFSSISFGQMETAKRHYTEAHRHFEDAFRRCLFAEARLQDRRELSKLCHVMCGVGRANLTFGDLMEALRGPPERTLEAVLKWRRKGGPFDAKQTLGEAEEGVIDLDRPEMVEDEEKMALVIEKLVADELNQS